MVCTAGFGATGGDAAAGGVRLEPPAPLVLSLSAAYSEPETAGAAGGDAAGPAPATKGGTGRFGAEGSWWLTLGGGAATDLDNDRDFNLHVAFSNFLATDLEFALEAGGWYFDQEGPNTGGVNGNLVFRWHFLHAKDDSYTVYGDVGIGLLGSFDDTPADGTSFNFTPRAGVGTTIRLTDDGVRLQLGVRYHHISNARIEGDSNNPSRDSIMAYFGFVFPL